MMDFKHANALCHQIAECGSDALRYANELKVKKHSAFVPYLEFTNSFCTTQETARAHNESIAAKASMILGRPYPPYRTSPEEFASLYRSPITDRLRALRDQENGVGENQIDAVYPNEYWRREIDPCERGRQREQALNREAYEARWANVLTAQRNIFRSEVEEHATREVSNFGSDKDGSFLFYKMLLNREVARLGFRFDSQKSTKYFSVFSKEIYRDWDLCVAPGFEPLDLAWNPPRGHLEPSFELRPRKTRGPLDNVDGQGRGLCFRFSEIIPGFRGAYRTFCDLDEMEALIKAHLCLYETLSDRFERLLLSGLKRMDVE